MRSKHTYIHQHIHTYIHAYTNTYIHTYIHQHNPQSTSLAPKKSFWRYFKQLAGTHGQSDHLDTSPCKKPFFFVCVTFVLIKFWKMSISCVEVCVRTPRCPVYPSTRYTPVPGNRYNPVPGIAWSLKPEARHPIHRLVRFSVSQPCCKVHVRLRLQLLLQLQLLLLFRLQLLLLLRVRLQASRKGLFGYSYSHQMRSQSIAAVDVDGGPAISVCAADCNITETSSMAWDDFLVVKVLSPLGQFQLFCHRQYGDVYTLMYE